MAAVWPALAQDAEPAEFEQKFQAAVEQQLSTADFASFLLGGAEAGTLTKEQAHLALNELPAVRQKLVEPTMTRYLAKLASGTSKQAAGLLVLGSEVFAADPSRFERMKRLTELADQADGMLSEGRVADLLELVRSTDNATERTMFAARLTRAVGVLERQMLASPDAFVSLKELALYQKVIPTERAANIAEGLVQKILVDESSMSRPAEQWTVDDPTVAGLLKGSAQINPTLKQRLWELYEKRIRALVTADIGEPLMRSYAGLLENRPDPDARNDALRLWIVLNAESGDVRQFALGRLEELRYSGAIGKLDQLRITLRGYYGKGISIFFISSFIIVLFCAALMAFRPLFIQGVSDAIAQAEARSQKRAEKAAASQAGVHRAAERPRAGPAQAQTLKMKRPLPRKEKYVPGYARGPVEKDEYTKLMEYMGLEDDASEAAIKRAYRDRVKSLHPDAKPGEADTADESFIELKEVYDRIQEIRGSWFGGKK